jgi:hypothetical protein
MLRQTLIVRSFALLASAPLLGGCIPSTTPDPAASAAAQTEMKAFEPFLREPLCEQIAVNIDWRLITLRSETYTIPLNSLKKWHEQNKALIFRWTEHLNF